MAEFKLTNKAVEDLSRIWNYTLENWSEKQADKYYESLISRCQDISTSPILGKNYDDILEGLSGSRCESHIIFYRVISNRQIEIIRILHSRMDLKRKLLK